MKKGIQFALITSFISGFSIFYSKLAVAKMDPLFFTTLKNAVVAVFLSVLILTPKIMSELTKLNRSNWKRLIAIGLIGGGIPFALFFIGLTKTPAINANLIHKTLFIWVALLAIPLLKEKLKPIQIVGYVLVLAANLFVGGFKSFTFGIGELMILGATVLWAVENILAKKTLASVSPMIVAWARMTFGLVILLAIIAYQGKLSIITTLTPAQLQIGLVSGLLLTGYVLSWYKALSLAPATVVSAVLVSATIVTNVLTVVFIDHKAPTIGVNMILLTIGLLLIVLFSRRRNIAVN